MPAWTRVAAAVLLIAVLAPAFAAACPLCKDATSDSDTPGQTSVWRGMYWSILLMIVVPFAMAGTMIVVIRRARKRREASLPVPATPLAFPHSYRVVGPCGPPDPGGANS
jgi:hypothetical protein